LGKRGHEITTINWRSLGLQSIFLPVDEAGFDAADVPVASLLAEGAQEEGTEAYGGTGEGEAEELVPLHGKRIDSGIENISPWVISLRTGIGYDAGMRVLIGMLVVVMGMVGETWTGTVVDVMCKGKDLASHTRDCAVNCAKGGYGLVLADGKFVKFDEGGNARTLGQLKKLGREKDLKAKVTGEMVGDVIKVGQVEFQ
jgi:hypothetical protein